MNARADTVLGRVAYTIHARRAYKLYIDAWPTSSVKAILTHDKDLLTLLKLAA